MREFSKIEMVLNRMREEEAERAAFRPIEPFSPSEKTPQAVARRLKRVLSSYWEFDKEYFPPDMYSDGYSDIAPFHRRIHRILNSPGLHVLFGPRKHGKTATAKKNFAWLQLSGRIRLCGTFSETLDPKSSEILTDVGNLINENERILHDFDPKFTVFNSYAYRFRTQAKNTPRSWVSCAAFSEGRSAKGAQKLFSRIQYILGDDVETITTPFGAEQNRHRIAIINECFGSMTDNGTFAILGNDFNQDSALHALRTQQDDGILPKGWFVHAYEAWRRGRPLWPQRYPAQSETELRNMLKPLDDADWQGNYQQKPAPPDGFIFTRAGYKTYSRYSKDSELPPDARGVAWCDPNLAQKHKGDTTAMLALLYSAKEDCYYVVCVHCRSYSDSHKLLSDYLKLKEKAGQVYALGFDGHVNQESTWTQFVRDYCLINNVPFPPLEYRRYRVDDLAKNVQAVWNKGKIKFPEGFAETPEGEQFLRQVFAFQGKKSNKKDDAPDALICAFELLHERGLATRTSTRETYKVITITDSYSF